MEEDFNTPEALAILFDLSHEINKIRSESLSQAIQLGSELRRLGKVLGLLQAEPEMFLQGTQETGQALSTTEIENMIVERKAARERRDWAAADQIRTDLKAKGITLEDGAQGTTWRKI